MVQLVGLVGLVGVVGLVARLLLANHRAMVARLARTVSDQCSSSKAPMHWPVHSPAKMKRTGFVLKGDHHPRLLADYTVEHL